VAGSEVWVFDTAKHTLLKRFPLEKPAKGIAVSQDAAPQLYAVTGQGDLAILDARSGKPLKTAKFDGGGPLVIAPSF
jgi:methylamine dehydrogenase heavy chain